MGVRMAKDVAHGRRMGQPSLLSSVRVEQVRGSKGRGCRGTATITTMIVMVDALEFPLFFVKRVPFGSSHSRGTPNLGCFPLSGRATSAERGYDPVSIARRGGSSAIRAGRTGQITGIGRVHRVRNAHSFALSIHSVDFPSLLLVCI